MELISKIYQQRRKRLCLIYLISLTLTIFFIFHLINGRNGIKNYGYLQQEYRQKQQELVHKKQLLTQKESFNQALKSKNLDEDFLETLARSILGYSKSNELIIYR